MFPEHTSILVADQYELVCMGLREQFKDNANIEVVGFADTGMAVLEYLEKDSVDVILIDVSLPGMDGIDTTRLVHKQYPDQILIGHSFLNEIEYINSMLIEGARGYILKGADKAEFECALGEIANGGQYLSEAAQAQVAKGYSYTAKHMDGEYMGLTSREREIIICVAKEMTNQETADLLFLSIETVRSHRKNLMTKLNVKSTAGLAKYAVDRRWLS